MSEFFDPCPAGGVFIENPPWDNGEKRCPECGRNFHLTGYEARWPDHSRASVVASIRELSADEVEALGDDPTLRSGITWNLGSVPWMEFTLENGDVIVGLYPNGEAWEGIRA